MIVNFISRWVDKLTYVMHLISGTILVLMMFVTLADVVTRLIFNLSGGSIDITFIGGVEMIKYGLLLVVFFALPHSLNRSQVIVDLFTDALKTETKARLEGFYILGYALLGFGMSYRFYHAIEMADMSGETTQDLLLPLSNFYIVTCFASGVLAVVAVLSALRLFMYGREELPR